MLAVAGKDGVAMEEGGLGRVAFLGSGTRLFAAITLQPRWRHQALRGMGATRGYFAAKSLPIAVIL